MVLSQYRFDHRALRAGSRARRTLLCAAARFCYSVCRSRSESTAGEPAMSLKDLESVARAIVAPKKGIPRRRREHSTIASASTRSRSSRPRRHAARYRELLFTTPKAPSTVSGVILYDETIRQKTRDGVRFRSISAATASSRHQGRYGRQGSRGLSGREDHRGPGRAARAAGRVLQARRALRQVARRDHDRQRRSDAHLHHVQRARARALRGALPGANIVPSSSPKC
jgi:hypothetical protein